MSGQADPVPGLLRAEADALFGRLNEQLDTVLGELRVDMIKRGPEDDAIAWLVNRRALAAILTNPAFVRDMLTVAMYRLARYEVDH